MACDALLSEIILHIQKAQPLWAQGSGSQGERFVSGRWQEVDAVRISSLRCTRIYQNPASSPVVASAVSASASW